MYYTIFYQLWYNKQLNNTAYTSTTHEWHYWGAMNQGLCTHVKQLVLYHADSMITY